MTVSILLWSSSLISYRDLDFLSKTILNVIGTIHERDMYCAEARVNWYLFFSIRITTTMNTPDQFISKTTMTNLFHKSVVYHRRKLREIFRTHYNPFKTDAVWTRDVSEQVINDLRLHLSWDLGICLFFLNRDQLGTRIICRFKELGIFLFMKHVIINDLNN